MVLLLYLEGGSKMKIKYIEHSCFLIELEHTALLFDWYKGEIPRIDENKEIYVFSSHKHHDHFNMDIFNEMKAYKKVHYVLSKDIRLSPNYLERNGIDVGVKEDITFVGKNQSYHFGEESNTIEVTTLTSTDIGVAFVIQCEGKSIYHAGDLNWWSWPGDEVEAEKRREKEYVIEIDKLKDHHFDIAFVVVDPRQVEHYWWGLNYFMKVVDADVVFPMHFWGNYSIIPLLLQEKCVEDYKDRIVTITEAGQEFTI